jgi:NAD(P) transhydrogenase
MKKYELVVLGSGPAGEKAAVKAAYFGHKVAIVEKEDVLGGAMVNTGTLPSKTLKETSLFLSGRYEKELFGINRILPHEASVEEFMYRKNLVSAYEREGVKTNLDWHKVDIFYGKASFADPHTITITSSVSQEQIQGDYVIIATGSYPFQPPAIPFDGNRIHDSDTILNITRFPKSLCVVGAGVIGCEYATIFATMGTKVYLINNKDIILPFVDTEISKALLDQMRAAGISIIFNTQVKSLIPPASDKDPIAITLENGEPIDVDRFLYASGRNGDLRGLNVDHIGLLTGPRETLIVNKKYQTNIEHIYAVGDVIGFPALASTSMDQGRVAVAHIFQTNDLMHLPTCFPYGIYTIPEISTVGMSEEEAAVQNVSYKTGKAYYKDMARGKIMGAQEGFLKIVFQDDPFIPTILGVHVIGAIACEMIHFGMLLVENKNSLLDLINVVVNYPTLHDLYKYAAYDGLSNLRGHKVKH